MMKRILLLAAVLASGACARSMAPPGGEQDRLAPRLVATSPAPLTVVTDLQSTAVFEFDERLRTRSFNRTMVNVMPGAPEEMEIELHGNRLEVRREGGWLPGHVYQIVVRPGLEDMFGNKRDGTAELVFSTGPQIPSTALAGTVLDRITGVGAQQAVVEAVRRADSTVYRALADSAAFFALRHAPYGVYDVSAYSDRNRNGRRDPSEPADGPIMAGLGAGTDTLTLFFNLLPRDTTGPRLTRAEAMDSLHVRLSFDDYLPPDTGIAQARVTFYTAADSAALPLQFSMTLAAAHQARQARVQPAVRDTAGADSTAADTARARPPAPPPARVQPQPGRGQQPQAQGSAPDPATLPDRAVVLTLGQRLPPGEYIIVAENVRNVNGLTGGGHVRLQIRAPAPPAGR